MCRRPEAARALPAGTAPVHASTSPDSTFRVCGRKWEGNGKATGASIISPGKLTEKAALPFRLGRSAGKFGMAGLQQVLTHQRQLSMLLGSPSEPQVERRIAREFLVRQPRSVTQRAVEVTRQRHPGMQGGEMRGGVVLQGTSGSVTARRKYDRLLSP